jgi:Ca2+-binding EF-hand superfamily protein
MVRNMVKMCERHEDRHYEKSQARRKTLTPAELLEIRQMFRLFDTDNDKTLSVAEILEAMGGTKNSVLTMDDITAMTAHYSHRQDHALTEDEFVEFFSMMSADGAGAKH